jgi:hypothetical protein
MSGGRPELEFDHELATSGVTAPAGMPLPIERCRRCGVASMVDAEAQLKRRRGAFRAPRWARARWRCRPVAASRRRISSGNERVIERADRPMPR